MKITLVSILILYWVNKFIAIIHSLIQIKTDIIGMILVNLPPTISIIAARGIILFYFYYSLILYILLLPSHFRGVPH